MKDSKLNPKYPIYIISKGRWDTRLTAKSFEKMNTPYRIVVEPQEYQQYANVIDPQKIIKTPEDFSKLGKGSIPVRNFVWKHSIDEGHKRHWIIDDNIDGFYRYNRNFKLPVTSANIFRASEDFVDRYTNVGMSGLHYFMFVSRKCKLPPYYLNTRIYSTILLNNDLYEEFPWRGRYNEDTDLSLRILKAGYCTVLFNAFLAMKTTTMVMKGGNEQIYNESEGRKLFAESLKEQHPDVVQITKKWGRWHHHVDYRPFEKNKLIKKPGLFIPDCTNNYGMVLQKDNPDDMSMGV